MREMWAIATDVPLLCCVICLSVNLSVTRAGCAKTAERINVLFGMEIPGDLRNRGGLHSPRGGGRGFDAAFAKLLRPVVMLACELFIVTAYTSTMRQSATWF